MYKAGERETGASIIRAYLKTHYFEPARQRRETLVTLRAGDIHRERGLRNRVPSVCQVMESKRLEREAGVKVSSKQGPPSGNSTTLTVTYAVEGTAAPGALAASPADGPRPVEDDPGWALFYSLRGRAAGYWGEDGGSDKWMANERANFYGPAKEELK